jgi:hypothetical protein
MVLLLSFLPHVCKTALEEVTPSDDLLASYQMMEFGRILPKQNLRTVVAIEPLAEYSDEKL